MTAPSGIVTIPDDQLCAALTRIRPALRAMADGDGSEAGRAGARLALSCVETVIRDIRERTASPDSSGPVHPALSRV